MSGAVAIGIIAAASQLAAYSIKIVLQLDDFCAEVRSTPIRTRQHLNQVKELIETANLIGQHKSLQLPAVNAKLQSTLFEAQLLYGILKEASARYTANSVWRHWAVLRGVDEQKILTSLNKLEREKSALKLCITIVHTDLLLGIQGSIDKVSTRRMAEKSGQGSPTSELIDCPNQEPIRYRVINGERIPVKVGSQEGKHEDIKTKKDQPPVAKHQTGYVRDSSGTGHHFENVSCETNSKQHNGDNNINGSKALGHDYGTVVARDKSDQHNGNNNGVRFSNIVT